MRNSYLNAFEKLQVEDHDKASEEFDEVKRQYRYSSWAAKAQLMLAYPSYRKQNLNVQLVRFITLHPHHLEITYGMPMLVFPLLLRLHCRRHKRPPHGRISSRRSHASD
jgi:outer membrane protein assembly factor BamD (BamD/ComL family)